MKIDSSLTKSERAAIVEANKTSNGGWSKEFLESIGVSWPPPQGWKGKFIQGKLSNKKTKQKHKLLKKREGWTKTSCIVYVLRCPVTRDIRYVGQTRLSAEVRLKWHIKNSKKRSAPVSRWIKSLEYAPIIEIVDSKAVWDITEAVVIDRLIKNNHKLLNVCSVIKDYDIA